MSILSRFKKIMASNRNAASDKKEQPEKQLKQFMTELNMDLGQIKAESLAIEAEEQRAGRALGEARAEVEKLHKYAAKSLEAGDDAQARKFLEMKAVAAEKEKKLQEAYDQIVSKNESLLNMQSKVSADLQQLEERHTRLKSMAAETKIQQGMNEANSSQGAFAAWEDAIHDAQDKAAAKKELQSDDVFDERFEQQMKQSRRTDN